MTWGSLFAGLACLRLFAGRRLSRGTLRLVSAMMTVMMRQGLRDCFIGELGWAAKMQNIVCD
jgi:hypothetical protein